MTRFNKLALSIIIPVFNGEKYIERCVKSVFDQGLDVKKFEILLIDDGSSDNSMLIIKKLVRNHTNINFLQQANKGPGAARNLGMKEATGDYIYFIDCDDYLIRGAFNNILELAQSNDLDVLGFGSKAVFDDQDYENETKFNFKIENPLDIQNGCNFIAHHNFQNEVWWYLTKRAYIEKTELTFPEGRMLEDVAFTAKLLIQAKKISYIPFKIHCYFRHSESILTISEPTHYQKLIDDYEKAVFDYEKVITLVKNCSEAAINRVKTRQQSFVFFMIMRFFKSKGSYTELHKSLKRFEEINAYPLYRFIGKDYNSFQLKLMTFICNHKILLRFSFHTFRLLKR